MVGDYCSSNSSGAYGNLEFVSWVTCGPLPFQRILYKSLRPSCGGENSAIALTSREKQEGASKQM